MYKNKRHSNTYILFFKCIFFPEPSIFDNNTIHLIILVCYFIPLTIPIGPVSEAPKICQTWNAIPCTLANYCSVYTYSVYRNNNNKLRSQRSTTFVVNIIVCRYCHTIIHQTRFRNVYDHYKNYKIMRKQCRAVG